MRRPAPPPAHQRGAASTRTHSEPSAAAARRPRPRSRCADARAARRPRLPHLEVMRGLRRRGVPSIMPLASRGRLADALHRGRGPHLTTHRIGGPQGWSATLSATTRRDRALVHVSAGVDGSAGTSAQRCRQRLGVETGHRLMDEARTRGLSRSPALRPLLLSVSMVHGAAGHVGAPALAAGEAAPRTWRPALASGSLPAAALPAPDRAGARPGAGLDVAGGWRHHTTQCRRCSHLSSHAVSVWPTTDDDRRAIAGALVVWRTSDAGATWERLSEGLPQQDCHDVVLRHAADISGDTVAMGSTTGDLWVSVG